MALPWPEFASHPLGILSASWSEATPSLASGASSAKACSATLSGMASLGLL